MIRTHRQGTVRVTKVKGHASDAEQGRVRLEDKLGIDEADAAAGLGRCHQSELLMDARRVLLNARNYWYPIMLQLPLFMVAISRVAVNHDGKGGSAPDPLVWDQGLDIRVHLDLASLHGPPGFLRGPWVQVRGGCITSAYVAAWPYSVDILWKFSAFWGTLHWPADTGGACFRGD